MAAYYYGIELYAASIAVHDGEIDGKKVQIKISKQDNIVFNHEPEYLIVMYLNKSGNVYEVYDGLGKEPWNHADKGDSHNNCHMMVNKLMELDKTVSEIVEVIGNETQRKYITEAYIGRYQGKYRNYQNQQVVS